MCELDYLAELLAEPDKNMDKIEHLWNTNEKLSILTNNTQNIYYDAFQAPLFGNSPGRSD